MLGKGVGKMKNGVQLIKNKYWCLRCGNHEQQFFGHYYAYDNDMQEIVYCRLCTQTAQSNTLPPPPQRIIKSFTNTAFSYQLPFPLTNPQREAIWKLKANLKPRHTLLLQAVCGAGKTEIIASTIAYALQIGKCIGWTIARKDVVIEIAERLREYFPHTKIVALYQASDDLQQEGQLTVLTTARLYEFGGQFDILIVDENDAYPFNIDQRQQFAARQSITNKGTIIHISATVPKMEKKRYQYITSIAHRFHAFDLPAITFAYLPLNTMLILGRLFGKIKQKIEIWLEQKYPIFIFVSNKQLGYQVNKMVQRTLSNIQSCFVSSDIADRTPILTAIRNQEIDLLVTTTILERGVTFKSLQVIVLDADAQLFDAQTLIQIAGRVGRNINDPDGVIHFCYQQHITTAMRIAKQYHLAANKGVVNFL